MVHSIICYENVQCSIYKSHLNVCWSKWIEFQSITIRISLSFFCLFIELLYSKHHSQRQLNITNEKKLNSMRKKLNSTKKFKYEKNPFNSDIWGWKKFKHIPRVWAHQCEWLNSDNSNLIDCVYHFPQKIFLHHSGGHGYSKNSIINIKIFVLFYENKLDKSDGLFKILPRVH